MEVSLALLELLRSSDGESVGVSDETTVESSVLTVVSMTASSDGATALVDCVS